MKIFICLRIPTYKATCFLFFFSLLFIFLNTSGQSSTLKETVTLDWKSKSFTDNTLPFDWPFLVKVTNIDPNTQLFLTVKSINSKDTFSRSIIFPPDNKLNTVQAAFDTALEPNKSYKLIFTSKQSINLSGDEKSKIEEFLKNNEEFKNEFKNKLYSVNYFDAKASMFIDILNKYLKQIMPDKDFNLSNISNLDAEIQLKTALPSIKLLIIGQKVNTISEVLQKKGISFKEKEIKEIKGLIKKQTDGFLVPDMSIYNGSEESYVNALEEIRSSVFKSEYYKKLPDTGQIKKDIKFELDTKIDEIKNNFTALSQDINDWITTSLLKIIVEEIQVWETLGTTAAEGDTKASVYISQTVGAFYSTTTDNILSYLSYSFFFRPVNQEIPLSSYKGWNKLWTRLCLNAGFTFNNISTNKNGNISGILGDKAIVIGAGFRLLSFLKFDINSLLFYLNDPNPLINRKHLNASATFGLSLNVNIAKLLAGEPNPLSDLQKLLK